MRITGRCQTAEEIARQLQLALLKVHRLERDLKPLVASLGRPGATHETIFRSEDIDYVAQLTESVIVSEDDGVLAIYGLNRIGTQNAHRLLLALLDQPHGSFNEFASIADDLISSTVDLPVGSPTVGVHRRYHGLELLRTVRPRVLKTDQSDDATASASANIDNLATSLSQQLDRVVPLRLPSTIAEPSDSYWRGQGVASAWKAKFCTLLHPKDQDQMPASNAKASSRPQTIIQHAAPCPEHLLSHFQASKNSGSSPSSGKISSGKYNLSGEMLPYLKVHLKPFPQKPDSATVLPRLEMRFRFLASKVNAGSRKLILTGMQAVIDEQRLSVPLPGYATDLQFTRQSKLLANIDAVKVDPSILRFIKHLQQSARIDKGSLTAPAELSIKLPSWLGGSKEPDVSSASQDHATTYLFERFEQIQEIHFTPQKSGEQAQAMDVNVNSTLEALPGHIRLKYREVEGGAIYGNTTHLSLDFGRKQRIDEPSETEEESTHAMPPAISTLDLAGAALRIAELLTCSSAGTSKHNGETAKD
ncbi:uncharacterized protein RCC_08214 [Ramularia collo-cygni]|uniref:SLS1 C-terminal domain-containing protein n=1 Tax=Ramularia collo-cygni TaxID=112498 RepID=A0A2D3V6L4_9PEZI|nr:uncharacterized protein RCC_08214 [Ramularia collo-cygni]CZT22345.1 uncharacterized protein RCC_08214 [Ramularia collo-cygni]